MEDAIRSVCHVRGGEERHGGPYNPKIVEWNTRERFVSRKVAQIVSQEYVSGLLSLEGFVLLIFWASLADWVSLAAAYSGSLLSGDKAFFPLFAGQQIYG